MFPQSWGYHPFWGLSRKYGWFMMVYNEWKFPIQNGWWLGGPPFQETLICQELKKRILGEKHGKQHAAERPGGSKAKVDLEQLFVFGGKTWTRNGDSVMFLVEYLHQFTGRPSDSHKIRRWQVGMKMGKSFITRMMMNVSGKLPNSLISSYFRFVNSCNLLYPDNIIWCVNIILLFLQDLLK